MTFFLIARVIAIAFASLFVILAFFPASYASTFGLAPNEDVLFVTRRAAPMFIGAAALLWFAATAPRSPLRDAIAGALALMCIGIAISGVIAFSQGIGGTPVLLGAAAECIMAASLWLSRKYER